MIYLIVGIIAFYTLLSGWLIYKKLHILPPVPDKEAEEKGKLLPKVKINGSWMDGVVDFMYLNDGVHVSIQGKRGDFIRWRSRKMVECSLTVEYFDWHFNFIDYMLEEVNLDSVGVIELIFRKEK